MPARTHPDACHSHMRVKLLTLLVATSCLAHAGHTFAGNCLVQGGRMIGDCEGVHVGPARPLVIKKSGDFSGNFASVTVLRGATAYLSGNTEGVTVQRGATLYLSGNSSNVRVEGTAELSGNTGWVSVAEDGSVVLRGIADGVSGPGKVVKVPGAIIGGVYIR